jgi:hypothetical protein
MTHHDKFDEDFWECSWILHMERHVRLAVDIPTTNNLGDNGENR